MESATVPPVPLKILLVEDDLAMAEIIERMLERLRKAFAGSQIIKVQKLADAVALMGTPPHPDVMLLDLMLEDTLAVDDAISEIDSFSKICPVIVITGHFHSATEERVMKAGASAFVGKDILTSAGDMLIKLIAKFVSPGWDKRHKELKERLETMRTFLDNAPPKK